MVGAIGFEPTPLQSFQTLAGPGWQPKDRNGSHWNNYWTRIGHGLCLRSWRTMQNRNKGCSLKLDRVTSENPNTRALPSPRSDKDRELTKVKPERELTRVKPEAEKQNQLQERSATEIAREIERVVLEQCCSRLARGDDTNAVLYRRFIVQAAEANSDFFARKALTFDDVSIALEKLAPRDTLEAMLSVQIVGVHA